MGIPRTNTSSPYYTGDFTYTGDRLTRDDWTASPEQIAQVDALLRSGRRPSGRAGLTDIKSQEDYNRAVAALAFQQFAPPNRASRNLHTAMQIYGALAGLGGAGVGPLAGSGAGAGAGAATISASDAAAGIGAGAGSGLGAAGLAPISVSATPMAGGIAAIEGITPAIMGGGAIPAMASMPAVGGAVAGGGGLGQTLSNMFGVRDASGALDWSRIMELGGAALGAANALGNRPEEAQPPARAPWMDAPLSVPEFSRTQTPMAQDAYYTYGQSGPEHQFFSQPTMGTTPEPTGPPDVRTPTIGPRLPGLRVLHDGGGVSGPGTGRSDEIPAQLSDGEYVIDAESVALLGDGSSEAGAKKLDQLRERIRQHKGKALAKGKFSPDSKEPEEYMGMAKGGGSHRLLIDRRREPRVRESELEALRRLVETYRMRHIGADSKGEPQGYNPYDRPATTPKKKAEGGRIRGVNMLADLVDKLENSLDLNDNDSQTIITRQIEAIEPKFKMAKGGNVRQLIARMRAALAPLPPLEQIKAKHPKGSAVVSYLERTTPRPDIEQLEGEELLKLLDREGQR